MVDIDIVADPELSPADRAVKYMLDRIRVDPELRWLMLGTEAFEQLLLAEALRIKPASTQDHRKKREAASNHPDAKRSPALLTLRVIAEAAEDFLVRLKDVGKLLPEDECIKRLNDAMNAHNER